MFKPIIINSYPRSGSGFLGQLLHHVNFPDKEISIMHSIRLIGIKEATTITILRNPKDCISSNIFMSTRHSALSKDISTLDEKIMHDCNVYTKFLTLAKSTSSYMIDFNKLVKDPEKEVNKFLEYLGLNPTFSKKTEDIFDLMEKEKYFSDLEDVYGGHFPRGVEKHPDYARIYEYIHTTPLLDRTYDLYLSTINELP